METHDTTNEMSDKRLKFRRLANQRTNKALKAINHITNLSRRASYEWEDSEVQKIIEALRDAVSAVEKSFAAPQKRPLFKL
jgi:hypothetical protein